MKKIDPWERMQMALCVGLTVWIWIAVLSKATVLVRGIGAEEETPAPVITVTAADYIAPPNVVVEEPEPEPEIDPDRLEQLAIGIYREAGGDNVCDDCRRRVGDVMLNREADCRFPDTLAKVLTQKRQYGTMYWDGITWPERASKPEEAHAVERAYRIAEEILRGEHSDLHGQGYIYQSEFPNLGTERVECCGIYYAKG